MSKDGCTCSGFDHPATDPTVVVVQIDNWEAMYVRGRCVQEEHRIPLRDIAAALQGKLEVRALHGTPFEEHLNDGNFAPDNLAEVPNGH